MYVQNPVNFFPYKVVQKNVQHSNNGKISFEGGINRAPFNQKTVELIDNIYKKYNQEAHQVPIKEITSSVENILATEKGTSKQEVLDAMQKVTQFANIESLKNIIPYFKRDNIVVIGNKNDSLKNKAIIFNASTDFLSTICDDSGINSTLDYLLTKKGLFTQDISFRYASNHKINRIAIFLDKNKIADLEILKRKYPDKYEKLANNKFIKYYYLSGFDEGITFLNRNKDLETETRLILDRCKKEKSSPEKILDADNLERINALGIKPTIIKNDNSPTVLNVFKQMRNIVMSKNELFNVIEANTIARSTPRFYEVVNHIVADNLNKTLKVYTPEKIAIMLQEMHKKIIEYAKNRNIDEKDICYIIPYKNHVSKSLNLINYSYEKINNISRDKFIPVDEIENVPTPENKMFVILDDCAISGASISNIQVKMLSKLPIKKMKNVVFANLVSSDKFLKKYKKFVGKCFQNNPPIIIDTVSSSNNFFKNQFQGHSSYDERSAYSIVFPYMAPDNDSELASNIAILHHPNYNHGAANLQNLYSLIPQLQSIKNLDEKVKKVLRIQSDLIGTFPQVAKEKSAIKDFICNLFN